MKIIVSILFVLLFVCSFAQTGQRLDYRFHYLTPADGLAGNHALFIVQDADGYVWIYTFKDGLQRYDGIRFQEMGRQFLNRETNTYQIQELAFFDGYLYVRAAGEIFVYNPMNQKFDTAHFRDHLPRVSFSDEKGGIWEIGDHSLSVYNKDGKRIYEQTFLNRFSGVNSKMIYDSVRSQYWLSKDAELYLLDVASGKVFSSGNHHGHPLLQFLNRRGDFMVANMIVDTNDNFWIATWGGHFYKFNLRTHRVKEYFIAQILEKEVVNIRKGPLGINHLFLDNHCQLWACTYGAGLLKYNKESDNFDYLVADKSNQYGIQYNYETKSMLQDRQDNIWVGTDKGISIFNPYREYFKTLRNEPGNAGSLPYSEITTVFQRKNSDLWVGTWGGGIAVYDSMLNFKNNYLFDTGETNMVWCFAEDGRGRIWAGCQGGWILRSVTGREKFQKPFRIFNHASTVTAMTADAEGDIYFGYNNGHIAKWNARKDSFYLFRQPANKKSAPIQFMRPGKQADLWVTDGEKLYQFDRQELQYKDSFSLRSANELSNDVIQSSSFQQINDSIFLMASVNGEPGYLNTNSRKFNRLNISENIVRKRIGGIERDRNGSIWFTSGFDLYQYIPGSQSELIDYYINGTVTNSPFLLHNMLPLRGGRRAVWTSTEVVVFEPDEVSRSREKLRYDPVIITGFKVAGRHILIDSLLRNNQPVFLKYNQNFITIEFSPLFFMPAYQKKYVYKLSGINQDWITADEHFSAGYTNLKPGNYTFKIKPEGTLADNLDVSFQIVITPPFYQTWWFYTLSAISAVALTSFLVRRRIGVIRKEAGLKQKVLETEMAALRAQMNPHFIFNCLSAIDNLIQNNEKDKATLYLTRFAKLIRDVLDSSRNEVVLFGKDLETLEIFIELEKLRSNDKFRFELQATPELLEGDYKIPPMLIQPFIENAIHHGLRNKEGEDKCLKVDACIENNYITYTITDNGVGRKRAWELKQINRPDHVSYGIKISNDRIRIFNRHDECKNIQQTNEDLIITDLFEENQPAGTMVKVKLKINS